MRLVSIFKRTFYLVAGMAIFYLAPAACVGPGNGQADTGAETPVEEYISRLGEDDAEVVQETIDILVEKGEAALRPLIEALTHDNKNVRMRASETLGLIGSGKAVEPLLERLDDREPEVIHSAAVALGRIGGERPLKALKGIFSEIRLGVKRDNPKARAAVAGLAEMGAPAIDSLIEMLGSQNLNTSFLAAETLGKIRDPKAVTPLLQRLGAIEISGTRPDMLTDEQYKVLTDDMRETAIRPYTQALADIGIPAVEELVRVLRDREYSPLIRAEIAKVLGQIGDPRAITPLLEVSGDPEWLVRIEVVSALGSFPGERALEAIKKAHGDGNELVRQAADEALIKFMRAEEG